MAVQDDDDDTGSKDWSSRASSSSTETLENDHKKESDSANALLPGLFPKSRSFGDVIFVLTICAVYIFASTAYTLSNKFLMDDGRFPYAWVLTGWHVTVTFSCCAVLHMIVPGAFPASMAARENLNFISKYFPIIATLFVLGAVMANLAMIHCSLPFIQFMKQSNIGMAFVLSLLVGLQTGDRVKVLVLIWILCFAGMAVAGEKSFSQYGFLLQLLSQACETSKAVFQEWLMGRKLRLDPLTYQLCLCPFAFVPLGIGIVIAWDSQVEQQAVQWWPVILANGLCAFLLNVSVAAIIKYAGAIGFLLAAVAKDICIVSLSTYFYHDVLELQQVLGFSLALTGILYWGLWSAAPKSPLVTWLPTLVGSSRSERSEKSQA